MPAVITTMSSDWVRRGRNGRMVSGASACPITTEAATLSDSAPLAPIRVSMTLAAMPLEAAASTKHALCRMELANAQNFGLIPSFGKLSDPDPKATDVQGRYVCQVATPAAKYTIMADLVCSNLGDRRCVELYSVAQGSTVLYQRQGQ